MAAASSHASTVWLSNVRNHARDLNAARSALLQAYAIFENDTGHAAAKKSIQLGIDAVIGIKQYIPKSYADLDELGWLALYDLYYLMEKITRGTFTKKDLAAVIWISRPDARKSLNQFAHDIAALLASAPLPSSEMWIRAVRRDFVDLDAARAAMFQVYANFEKDTGNIAARQSIQLGITAVLGIKHRLPETYSDLKKLAWSALSDLYYLSEKIVTGTLTKADLESVVWETKPNARQSLSRFAHGIHALLNKLDPPQEASPAKYDGIFISDDEMDESSTSAASSSKGPGTAAGGWSLGSLLFGSANKKADEDAAAASQRNARVKNEALVVNRMLGDIRTDAERLTEK